MPHAITQLSGFSIGATDGEIGEVTDVYFDDTHWTIRYMVVATGRWLRGRKVLISPLSVRGLSWDDAVIDVALSRQQVRDSPSIDTDKPVSRQYETDYYNHYGYPNYWERSNPWGLGTYPMPWVGASPDAAISAHTTRDNAGYARRQLDSGHRTGDAHLRSSNRVIGYEVMASDGPAGVVADFVFDDSTWAIRHVVVDTRKWLHGRHVLLSPERIEGVSWPEHEVYVKIARELVEASPEYDPALPLARGSAMPADDGRDGSRQRRTVAE